MTTIDWAQMMANSAKIGEPIPEGDYAAVAEEVTFGDSRQGDPQWKITWRLIGGPHNSRRVFDNQTLASGGDEKSAQRRGFFFRDMKSLGLGEQFFAQMPPGEAVAQAIQGINAMITIVINGQYNNVQRYALMSAGQAGAMQQPHQQPALPQQGGFQQPQGFVQQPQTGFQPQMQPAAAQGGFQQPQQPMQPQFQQPAPQQGDPNQFAQPMGQPQGGFQQPAQQPQMAPQPGMQQMPPQGFAQPQAAPQQGLMQPQMGQQVDPQQGMVQQPQQPAPDPNQPQNGQQAPQQYTPQPQPPF
jgi:hypothetical protein